MRYADVDRRLKALESSVPDPAAVGRIVTIEVVDGTPAAEARRIQARTQAGPSGIVIEVVRPRETPA